MKIFDDIMGSYNETKKYIPDTFCYTHLVVAALFSAYGMYLLKSQGAWVLIGFVMIVYLLFNYNRISANPVYEDRDRKNDTVKEVIKNPGVYHFGPIDWYVMRFVIGLTGIWVYLFMYKGNSGIDYLALVVTTFFICKIVNKEFIWNNFEDVQEGHKRTIDNLTQQKQLQLLSRQCQEICKEDALPELTATILTRNYFEIHEFTKKIQKFTSRSDNQKKKDDAANNTLDSTLQHVIELRSKLPECSELATLAAHLENETLKKQVIRLENQIKQATNHSQILKNVDSINRRITQYCTNSAHPESDREEESND